MLRATVLPKRLLMKIVSEQAKTEPSLNDENNDNFSFVFYECLKEIEILPIPETTSESFYHFVSTDKWKTKFNKNWFIPNSFKEAR